MALSSPSSFEVPAKSILSGKFYITSELSINGTKFSDVLLTESDCIHSKYITLEPFSKGGREASTN